LSEYDYGSINVPPSNPSEDYPSMSKQGNENIPNGLNTSILSK
jgi:hypothetical protein